MSLRAARRRGRGRRGARPAQLLGASCWARRARHEHAAQRFLNRSPCRRRRRFRAAARAKQGVATSKSGRDTVAAPRCSDQHPHSRGSASAESTLYDRKMSNSALDAPAGRRSAAGRCSRHNKTCVGPRFVDADVEGTDPSLRVPDVHGSRRARLAPQRPSGRTTGRSGCRRRDVQHYCVAALGSHSRTCRRRRARCVARV